MDNEIATRLAEALETSNRRALEEIDSRETLAKALNRQCSYLEAHAEVEARLTSALDRACDLYEAGTGQYGFVSTMASIVEQATYALRHHTGVAEEYTRALNAHSHAMQSHRF